MVKMLSYERSFQKYRIDFIQLILYDDNQLEPIT